MQKRISALLLAMVIVIGSVLNGNTLKVKAASATVAMSPELAAEFYMVLLQVAETAMHVSGANNGFNNKEAMEAIGDGVQGYFVTSMSEGVDFEFQTTDGQMLMCDKVTHKKLIDSNLLFRKISRNLLSKMIQYNSKKIFF